jgi:hypothetical protein
MSDLHFDASMGAAGDMILAALVDAGADEEFVRTCIAAIAGEAVLTFEDTDRCGMRAKRALVSQAQASGSRTWRSIRAALESADLPNGVRGRSLRAFAALAQAEAQVHGTEPESVHFHEVGALDSIVDIVGGCAALESLHPGRITCGPVATGTGEARTEHGRIPLPTPALVALLSGTGAHLTPGPADFEACTPTAAALLATWTDAWNCGPEMAVVGFGVGAGTADPSGHPNVVRVLLGRGTVPPQPSPDPPTATAAAAAGAAVATPPHRTIAHGGTLGGGMGALVPTAVVLQTNVDDLDPRLWPHVLQRLLDAGASDAWLSPIQMKKGRPAHTLHVLCRPDQTDALAEQVMRHTSAIGMRVLPCGKIAADRRTETVSVAGQPIRVKVASLDGAVVNVQPEWEDVRAAAEAIGRPAKQVLAAAQAAAADLWR